MYRSIVKVIQYPKETETTWSSTSSEILNTIDTQTDLNMQVKSDSFQLQLFGETTINFESFGLDDKIEVFAKNVADGEDITEIDTENSTAFDATFVFSGVLNNWKYNNPPEGSRQFIIQGMSVSERLLKTMLPAGYISRDTTTYNSTTIIQNLLELMNDKAGGKNLYWDSNNPSVNSFGNAFTTISYAVEYKPVYQQIADLSKDEYTGDGAYYYYVRSDITGNYIVWKKRNQLIVDSTLVENTHFVNPQVEYGVWDTVNYLIINAGKDPKGNGILTFYYDVGSMGELGTRSKYFPLDVSESLHKHEQSNSVGDFSENSRLPAAASYPYSTKFVDPKLSIVSEDVDDDAEYVDWFRRTAKKIARANGKAYVDRYKYARFKLKAEAPVGTNSLVVGNVYAIECPSIGWTGSAKKNLRLIDVKHLINGDGWNSEYEFEQDWEAVLI